MEWVIVLLVVIAVVGIAALVVTQARSRQLRQRFGPEYERAVEEHGSRRAAESRLREITQRRAELDVLDLTPQARATFVGQWREVQMRFVDEPGEAVAEAEALVSTVLRARGYTADDFDERAALISADHPDVVEDYRVAHDVHSGDREDPADTDRLRDAFVRYRHLFERLVDTDDAAAQATTRVDDDRDNLDVDDDVADAEVVEVVDEADRHEHVEEAR
ncbi:MAG TPA: hypothetical protein VF743_11815 [Acidimicrobiales bacterium]